jgi:hypothetical protein
MRCYSSLRFDAAKVAGWADFQYCMTSEFEFDYCCLTDSFFGCERTLVNVRL